MEFHFLWIIGAALFLGWLLIQVVFVEPKKMSMPRSWYSTPVIGLVMVFTWIGIQLVQLLS
jgi:hypothetical protein